MLHKLQNNLYTLNRCGLCLDTNLLLKYNNRRREEKRLQGFLSWEWIVLSNKVGAIETFPGFSSE